MFIRRHTICIPFQLHRTTRVADWLNKLIKRPSVGSRPTSKLRRDRDATDRIHTRDGLLKILPLPLPLSDKKFFTAPLTLPLTHRSVKKSAIFPSLNSPLKVKRYLPFRLPTLNSLETGAFHDFIILYSLRSHHRHFLISVKDHCSYDTGVRVQN